VFWVLLLHCRTVVTGSVLVWPVAELATGAATLGKPTIGFGPGDQQMKRFALLSAACLLSGCADQSASTNSTARDEVWLLPWGASRVGSSKENTQSASTNSTAGDEIWLLPWGAASGKVGSSKKNNAIRYYVRTDGQPIDSTQVQAVLAQCQGEGARSAYPWEYTNACMAHNGYVAQ
jgi:hypothetical protein